MHPAKISDLELKEIDGEPLEGSGFEAEGPASGFESDERSAEEGPSR